MHGALVQSVSGIKFGLAFCESSGPCLVRSSGTDAELKRIAEENALKIGAGHSFIIILGKGFYPINVLNSIKNISEVCRIFCATANPVEVILAETSQGRGVLGVIDGSHIRGIETEKDVKDRKEFLRKIGYKL
jgi:adenosine/AMP kinase